MSEVLNKTYRHVYAIVRLDDFHNGGISIENCISIKKVVWTQEEADFEVKRLNKLNAEKSCIYFWQVTRLQNNKQDR